MKKQKIMPILQWLSISKADGGDEHETAGGRQVFSSVLKSAGEQRMSLSQHWWVTNDLSLSPVWSNKQRWSAL